MWEGEEVFGEDKGSIVLDGFAGAHLQAQGLGGSHLSGGSSVTSEPMSPSLQTHLPVGRSPALNNEPGGNSQKSRDNKTISYVTSPCI